jgi:signal transduction histidine kinase
MSPDLQAYAVLIVASFNFVLTGIVLAQNTRNRVNVSFALLTLSAALWGFGTGMFLITSLDRAPLLEFFGRFNYIFGGSIAATFLYFSLAFASEKPLSRRLTTALFLPSLAFLFLYTSTDLIVAHAGQLADGSRGFEYGPWHYAFDVHTWLYFLTAFALLGRKYFHVLGRTRDQVLLILGSTSATFAVASTTNIVLPHILQNFAYIWIGPVAILLWVFAVTYAVAREQLFNIRLIASELPIILLWLVLIFRTALSQGSALFLINVLFFAVVLVLGVFFIRSVIKEAEQREMIERQEKELALINGQQEALLGFISHEVKSYFSKIEAAFAGIGEGDYGPPSPSLKTIAERGVIDVRTGMAMVVSILDASNLKQGTVQYKDAWFDLSATVRRVADDLRSSAESKGLTFTLSLDTTGPCEILGDEDKIRQHVVRNLIDNAIRYTIAGTVTIVLSHTESVALLTIEDTGVGITPEDMQHLFTEGGHGKDALKVNVHSTGYGLYIAKQVVDAHHGTIHALSLGAGKGSRFIVQLPINK